MRRLKQVTRQIDMSPKLNLVFPSSAGAESSDSTSRAGCIFMLKAAAGALARCASRSCWQPEKNALKFIFAHCAFQLAGLSWRTGRGDMHARRCSSKTAVAKAAVHSALAQRSDCRIGQRRGSPPEWLISSRTETERNYDRILFAAPTRRLGDKTQVFRSRRTRVYVTG